MSKRAAFASSVSTWMWGVSSADGRLVCTSSATSFTSDISGGFAESGPAWAMADILCTCLSTLSSRSSTIFRTWACLGMARWWSSLLLFDTYCKETQKRTLFTEKKLQRTQKRNVIYVYGWVWSNKEQVTWRFRKLRCWYVSQLDGCCLCSWIRLHIPWHLGTFWTNSRFKFTLISPALNVKQKVNHYHQCKLICVHLMWIGLCKLAILRKTSEKQQKDITTDGRKLYH